MFATIQSEQVKWVPVQVGTTLLIEDGIMEVAGAGDEWTVCWGQDASVEFRHLNTFAALPVP